MSIGSLTPAMKLKMAPRVLRSCPAKIRTITKRLTARDLDGLVAELHIRNAVLNGYTALRIRVTEAVG